MNNILERLKAEKIIPMVLLDDLDRAIPLMQALIVGGINCIEITYQTPNSEAIIGAIKQNFGDEVLVGAGAISSIEHAKSALAAGADYLVSSGFNNTVVEYCISHKVLIIPGVATCSEVETALNYGLNHLKFFPAEAVGGVKFLKAISAPYNGVFFMPSGGLTMDNFLEYKSLKNVFVCSASFIVTDKMLAEENYDAITKLCQNI